MKKLFTYLLFICILPITSCKKWLDVQPQGETTQELLFASQKGFRDALTGAYIRMKSGNIYGGQLYWGHIEYMANNWDLNPSSGNTAIPKLQAGTYTDATVTTWMDNIYQDLFKVIADANGILDHIDEKKSVFKDDNYAIIKGEALTLRAFCHFDALRLYGPIPSAVGSERYLPYVKSVSTSINQPLTYTEFTQALLADLDQAETLLKDVDPITKLSIAQLNPTGTGVAAGTDDYMLYRQLRMNYYAVLALKARIYLWLVPLGDENRLNAIKYAKMVTDAVSPTGAPVFRLGQESDRVSEDYTMSSEHIMALSVFNLKATASGTFGEQGNLFRYDFNISDGFYYLNSLFPVSERTSDIRWKQMWSYKTISGGANFAMYKKFIQKESLPILQLPLLRLSEMYLILTECAASKTEAETVYAALCAKKGIPFSTFNNSDWLTDRRNKIIREYVREFYGEGQSFFTYKRFNVTTLPSGWTYTYYNAKPAKYLVPKPLREINYNNN